MVAPGFIDIQSHSRRPFLSGDGRIVSKVTQGITTEILGEGGTNAPANEKTRALAGDDEEGFRESFTEIYHLKASGQRNWPKMKDAIARIDRARAEGLDVQANMYPYVAGGTGWRRSFPPGPLPTESFSRTCATRTRKRIHDEVLSPENEWENLGQLATPEGILIVDGGSEANARFVGRRLSEIAAQVGVDWVDAAIEILLEAERRAGMIVFGMDEANIALQMQQPWIKFGTDAGGFD
ncbi:MAG: hypothetical protein ACRD21_12780, partial [Vicinamibacteria bacterium]